jgi:branched-chain amino acid transport system permease protein
MTRTYFLLGLIFLILLHLPLFLSNYAVGLFVLIFFYAYLGQCWNIITGFTGDISLGHSLFVGIGAYTSTKLGMLLGISPWIGMFIGALLATLIGLIIGYLGFRFRVKHVYFILLTLAFAELGRIIVLHLRPLGHFMGIFIELKPGFANFQFSDNTPYYYIGLGYVVFSLIVFRGIQVSKLGRYLVALREDEDGAESIGVNSLKCKMIAMGISTFMTALAGTFYANYIFYIHPDSVMSTSLSIEIVLRPIVGGMGTIFGPVVGSFILTPMAEFSRTYFAKANLEGFHILIYGCLLIAAVLFFPKGIVSYLKRGLEYLPNISKRTGK